MTGYSSIAEYYYDKHWLYIKEGVERIMYARGIHLEMLLELFQKGREKGNLKVKAENNWKNSD